MIVITQRSDLPAEQARLLFTNIIANLPVNDMQLYLNRSHLEKCWVYFKETASRRDELHLASADFIYTVVAMLRRYVTFFGNHYVPQGRDKKPNSREGASFHAAVTERLMELLTARLGCGMECFASPLNCFYRDYCSAFFEIDQFFGSRGNFFDQEFL